LLGYDRSTVGQLLHHVTVQWGQHIVVDTVQLLRHITNNIGRGIAVWGGG